MIQIISEEDFTDLFRRHHDTAWLLETRTHGDKANEARPF